MPVKNVLVLVAAVAITAGASQEAQRPPGYLVAVASEAADRISLVRFTNETGRVESDIATGVMPLAIDGPHGLASSRDGRFFFVTLAHGQPYGMALKYRPRHAPSSAAPRWACSRPRSTCRLTARFSMS